MSPLHDAESRALYALKGVAITGVVIHHLAYYRFHPISQLILSSLVDIVSWSVPLFFVLSGFLHARSEKHAPRSIRAFVSSRSRRLLLPWLLVLLIYFLSWQLLKLTGWIPDIGLRGSIGQQLVHTLLALGTPVGVQLYFLPVLFAIALPVHAAWRAARFHGTLLLLLLTGLPALFLFPHAPPAGWSLDAVAWHTLNYLVGFHLHSWRPHSHARFAVLIACLLALAAAGPPAAARVLPLLAVLYCEAVSRFAPRSVAAVGEASGTIFLWHYPFLLLPCVAASSRLPAWQLQVPATLLAAFGLITLLTWLHQRLLLTRWKVLLY